MNDNTRQAGRNDNRWKALALVLGAIELLVYPYVVTVSGDCRFAPGKTEKVRAAISGRIAEVLVQEGERVKRGEVLIRFDDKTLHADMQHALAQRRNAKGAISQRYWQEEVERLRDAQALAVLRANADGEVLSPTQDLLGRQVDTGEELLTIADTRDITAEILVRERDIGTVASGQKTEVRAFSDTWKNHTGKVDVIVPKAEKEALGTFVIVKTRIDNKDGALVPGTTGVAKILGRRQSGFSLLVHRIARLLS